MQELWKRIAMFLLLGTALVGSTVSIPGCKEDSSIENAAEETGEAIEDAGEEISDAAEDAADDLAEDNQ